MVKGAGCPCDEEPKGLACRREPQVAMLRMDPSIEGSRVNGDDTNFVPPVGEDWVRCSVVKALFELDVRATDGEGEGEQICGDVWA